MKFFKIARKFRDEDSGAVTVDWVVLTAAIVGLGFVVINTVSGGTTNIANRIDAELDSVQPSATNATSSNTTAPTN